MAEAAQKNGFSAAAPVLVPLCSDLSVDDEPEIRQALAEQLPQLAKVFSLVIFAFLCRSALSLYFLTQQCCFVVFRKVLKLLIVTFLL